MARVVIENLLLFLLPAAMYVGYVMLVRRDAGNPRQVLDEAPLFTLFAIGAVLVVGTLAWFGSKHDGEPNLGYQPPVLKDGRIEPGRVK